MKRSAWLTIAAGLLAPLLVAACEIPRNEANIPDAVPPPDPLELMVNWELEPGGEGYKCRWLTLEEDIYVSSFDMLNGTGNHHLVVTYIDPDGPHTDALEPDGSSYCTFDVGLELPLLWTGALGTTRVQAPPEVGFKMKAGTQLVMNAHVYNTSDEVRGNDFGVTMNLMRPEDVVHEAEAVFYSSQIFEVPAFSEYSSTGYCDMPSATRLFTVIPHMHDAGTHFKLWIDDDQDEEIDDGEQVIHDEPFDPNEQITWTMDPITIEKGARVSWQCDWDNKTDKNISFGDYKDDEMCLTAAYVYPKVELENLGAVCSDDPLPF